MIEIQKVDTDTEGPASVNRLPFSRSAIREEHGWKKNEERWDGGFYDHCGESSGAEHNGATAGTQTTELL